jgi:hypothetical protein
MEMEREVKGKKEESLWWKRMKQKMEGAGARGA